MAHSVISISHLREEKRHWFFQIYTGSEVSPREPGAGDTGESTSGEDKEGWQPVLTSGCFQDHVDAAEKKGQERRWADSGFCFTVHLAALLCQLGEPSRRKLPQLLNTRPQDMP